MRLPIGQILVEQGQVSFEQMVTALNDFLDLKEKETAKPVAREVSPAADVGAPPPAPLAPLFLSKYQEFFTEERLGQVEGMFKELQAATGQKAEASRRALEHLSQQLHEMKEIVRFINAVLSVRILVKLVRAVDFFLDNPSFLDAGTTTRLAAAGPQTFVILRALRGSLTKTGSESSYWAQQSGVFTHFEGELSRFFRE
jgi:hypothetical protein